MTNSNIIIEVILDKSVQLTRVTLYVHIFRWKTQFVSNRLKSNRVKSFLHLK